MARGRQVKIQYYVIGPEKQGLPINPDFGQRGTLEYCNLVGGQF